MSLKQKLKLYKRQLRQETAGMKNEEEPPAADERAEENNSALLAAADQLGAQIHHLDNQFVFVHTEILPVAGKWGPYPFQSLLHAVSAWQHGATVHPLSAKGLRADDLLFFDTETTGLSSGSGQMIFLIGLARFRGNSVEMRQYFLPGPGHEAAFYDAFLRDTSSLKNLVTFNGKAFDWPRVKTRYQFIRDRVPRLPAFGHFDLLHASRRLWKKRMESVGLQNVEKNILGMNRIDDTPGKSAPFLYFQFLKNPDVSLIRGILEHNREDVLTLISLYSHLSLKILGLAPADPDERFEIARWYHQLGVDDKALPLFQRAAGEHSKYSWRALAYLAAEAKKTGNFGRSLALLEEAIATGMPNERLYIQMAKLLEHQFHNNLRALDYTKSAIEILKKKPDSSDKKKLAECFARLDRLDQKLIHDGNEEK